MQPLYLKNDTFLSHACLIHPLALASDCKSEIKMGKCLMKYRACACLDAEKQKNYGLSCNFSFNMLQLL